MKRKVIKKPIVKSVEEKAPEKRMNYFRRLIDSDDPASSQRFIGLAMTAFLIVASFFLLFVKVPNANANLVDRCLLYAVVIVSVTILGLKVDKIADVLINISKTQAAAQILTPTPPVTKVTSTEGGDVNVNNKDQDSPQVGDDVFEDDEDLRIIKNNLTKSLKTKE